MGSIIVQQGKHKSKPVQQNHNCGYHTCLDTHGHPGWMFCSVSRWFFLYSVSPAPAESYFLTIDEVLAQESKFVGRNIRISGIVLDGTIEYDEAAQSLSFTVANVPADYKTVEELGGLEKVLQEAATDPGNIRIKIQFGGTRPELLRDGAQAIMTGKLGSDGIFYADEILLRCPVRYEEAVPEQVK